MEPLPETREALEHFGPFGEDIDFGDDLEVAAGAVRQVVPTCVGFSLASLEHGVTFTYEATDDELAVLDGIQYLDNGPCVDAAYAGRTVAFDVGDPTDEERWHAFAKATAAHGVKSTLTLPILEGDTVTGTINIYAAAARAFDGHHERVAAIFHASAVAAVTNADLGFTTRRAAREAPKRLREEVIVSQAVGLLVAVRGNTPEAALAALEDAAARAGVTVIELARAYVDTRLDGDLP